VLLLSVLELRHVSDWTDVAQGVAAIAEIVALVVGGVWAYFLFVRGRTFSQRLEPLMEGELHQIDGVEMLRVKLRVKFEESQHSGELCVRCRSANETASTGSTR
jgi:hypothetical protein